MSRAEESFADSSAAGSDPLVEPVLTRGRAPISVAGYPGSLDRDARLANRDIRKLVPRWHFAMMNDTERNAAYEAAINATVRPGDLVLDIGTGSGLLALLAARAGAGRVITCEMEPLVASVAEQIVAANAYADIITVVTKPSTELSVGLDMPSRADVLVTEIFDCALLGEGVLPTLEHARKELLTPDARLIPGRGRLWGQLVESSRLRSQNHVTVACGFDVSTFNKLNSLEYFSTYLDNYPHKPLTEPFPLLDLDFNGDCPATEDFVKALPVTAGSADAIAIWFELDLTHGVSLSNGPQHPGSHWRQAVQTFDAPLSCESGEPVVLRVAHDRERVHVTPDSEPVVRG